MCWLQEVGTLLSHVPTHRLASLLLLFFFSPRLLRPDWLLSFSFTSPRTCNSELLCPVSCPLTRLKLAASNCWTRLFNLPLACSEPTPGSRRSALNVSSGGRVKTWKRRWFILTDNCLYYFEYTTVSISCPVDEILSATRLSCPPSTKDKEPRGIIPLENLSIREVEDSKKPVKFSI